MQMFDASASFCEWPEGADVFEDNGNNNRFGGEGTRIGSLGERLSLGSMCGDKGKGKGKK